MALELKPSETLESGRPQPKKLNRDERIAQLTGERRRLERQLSERAQEAERQKETLQARDHELALLQADREEQEARRKMMPERVAKAREEGRKLFWDFDAVISGVPVDRQAFEAILASSNGPELMYAAGLGTKMIGVLRQLRVQTQSDQQRIEYYRQMHQEHFAGETNGL